MYSDPVILTVDPSVHLVCFCSSELNFFLLVLCVCVRAFICIQVSACLYIEARGGCHMFLLSNLRIN